MISGVLAENLLILLVYNEQCARTIRGVVDPELWPGPYRTIAARCYDYLDRFKKPPGDHLPDILDDKINGESKKEGELYADLAQGIYEAREGVHPEYAMARLEAFVRRQQLRSKAVELAKALQRDTDDSLDDAEAIISSVRTASLSVFDPGIRLSDKRKVLKFLDLHNTALPTGIPELDKRGLGPNAKEIWLFIADTKGGKTWALIQLAKMALIHRHKVCHITLELSAERTSMRYMQSLFAVSKRQQEYENTSFVLDKEGAITGFDRKTIRPKLSLDDPNIRAKLERRIDRWSRRVLDNIFVKEFPTGQLTLGQLAAYLDNLEAAERFTPDLLIVDYPDLMSVDSDNVRWSLDAIYKGLRGIAVQRGIAVAIVSQASKEGGKAKYVTGKHAAEAYLKVAHADTVITYSQTDPERQLGLARLRVAAGRNDEDKFNIVISQQYGIGGFVIDSVRQRGKYFDNLPKDDQ